MKTLTHKNPLSLLVIIFSVLGMAACNKSVNPATNTSSDTEKNDVVCTDKAVYDTSIFIDITFGKDWIFQVQNPKNPSRPLSGYSVFWRTGLIGN